MLSMHYIRFSSIATSPIVNMFGYKGTEAHEQRTVYVLSSIAIVWLNGIIAAAIALPSSDIVLLRTFLGALSLVTILVIT